MLGAYRAYYHQARTHLSLAKDAPTPRRTQAITDGDVIAFSEVGGSTIGTNAKPPDGLRPRRTARARHTSQTVRKRPTDCPARRDGQATGSRRSRR